LNAHFSPTKKPLKFSTGLRNRLQGVTSLSVENCKGSPKILFANVTGFCFSQPAFHTGGQLIDRTKIMLFLKQSGFLHIIFFGIARPLRRRHFRRLQFQFSNLPLQGFPAAVKALELSLDCRPCFCGLKVFRLSVEVNWGAGHFGDGVAGHCDLLANRLELNSVKPAQFHKALPERGKRFCF